MPELTPSVERRERDAERDESIRVRVRKGAEDDAIHDTIDERVGADAEGERYDDDEGDARALAYRAPGIAHVLRERAHTISLR
jgi:hypothetical protein